MEGAQVDHDLPVEDDATDLDVTPKPWVMDPNAALEEIRRLSRAIDEADYDDDVPALAEELCVYIDSLDGWLMNGGALPDDWNRNSAR